MKPDFDLPEDLARLAAYDVHTTADVLPLLRRPGVTKIARATACRVLGRIGGKGAHQALTQQLRSASDGVVYWEAAKAIALLGDRRAVEQLGKLVNEPLEPRRRAAAAYALGMLGEATATKWLLKALQTPKTPPLVRAYVVEALGVLKALRALDAITDALTSDRSPQVRAAAAYALGRIGTRDTLSVLRRAVERDSVDVAHVGKVSEIARSSLRQIHRSTRPRSRHPELGSRSKG